MKIFPSVSFHITKPCNMACKFCYATYENLGRVKMLTLHNAQTILIKLWEAGVKKVTFAGGEPMLHPQLDDMIVIAKELGMTTGIITNGSLLSEEWLVKMKPHLDWVGLSIDSFDHTVNQKIGRVEKGQSMVTPYQYILGMLNELNYKVKVNTVINSYNYTDFCSTIDILNRFKIQRFKILRALQVDGQNDKSWNEIKCTDHMWAIVKSQVLMYMDLTDREDAKMKRNISNIVLEDTEDMTASYLLVNPKGQIYENWAGENALSPSLLTHSVEECMEHIKLDYNAFLNRDGLYEW